MLADLRVMIELECPHDNVLNNSAVVSYPEPTIYGFIEARYCCHDDRVPQRWC